MLTTASCMAASAAACSSVSAANTACSSSSVSTQVYHAAEHAMGGYTVTFSLGSKCGRERQSITKLPLVLGAWSSPLKRWREQTWRADVAQLLFRQAMKLLAAMQSLSCTPTKPLHFSSAELSLFKFVAGLVMALLC